MIKKTAQRREKGILPLSVAAFLACAALHPAHAQDPLAERFLDQLTQQTEHRLQPAAPMRFRMTSPAATTSPLVLAWNKALGHLAGITAPWLAIKPLHGGVVHGTEAGFKALRTDNAELATCYSHLRRHSMPLASAWGLPFIAPERSTVGSAISLALQETYIDPEFREQGVVLAGQYSLPLTNLLTRQPVRSLEDLAGMRIAATADQTHALTALGADPVVIPFPEYYVALQRGIVDGVLWVDIAMVAYRITEVAKYRTAVGLSGGSTDICLSNTLAARVSPDTFSGIRSFAGGMQFYAALRSDREWTARLDAAFAATGVQSFTLSPAEKQRWQQTTAPVLAQWLAETEEQGRPGAAYLNVIRAMQDHLSSLTDEDLASAVLAGLQSGTYTFGNPTDAPH